MKLKSYMLLTLIGCATLSCSNDDVPVEKPIIPIVPEATLDLSIQMDSKTKTKADIVAEDTPAWDYAVNRLTLVAFNATTDGAYDANNYASGQVVAVFDQKYTTPTTITAQNTGNALLAGRTDFLLFANLTDAVQAQLKALVGASKVNTKDDVLALAISLESENMENGLTMTTTDLGTLTVVAGKNYIGFKTDGTGQYSEGTEIYGKEVKLTRIVSCIQLNSITLKGGVEGCTGFDVKKVFLANVKGNALLSGETDATPKYWAGAYESVTGAYKHGEATLKDKLCPWDGDAISLQPGGVTAGATFTPQFVYPNQKGEVAGSTTNKNYTLLVIEGLYKTKTTTADAASRFYTIVVNDDEFNNGEGSSVDGKHIASNHKYTINVTIAGEGSDKPYDKQAYANISAKISVADWNVVEIINPPLD